MAYVGAQLLALGILLQTVFGIDRLGVAMLALCSLLNANRHFPWMNTLARGIMLTHSWAVVEVFIIGVIVSLVKIAAMATVTLGISFWAYAGFSICFTLAISSLDRFQCWRDIGRIEGLPA